MAYEKQNFVDGMLLNAEHLGKIEDGILELEQDVSALEKSVEHILKSDDCNVKYVESIDNQNLLVLREFESGAYILYGKFTPYTGSSETLNFTDDSLVNIVTKTGGTHVQRFYPVNNCIEFLSITDNSFERSTIYLNDLVSYVGTLSDLTTTEKSNLVGAINEVKNTASKKSTPRNLLDNSDWRVKERIVNQRGYTKWTPEAGTDTATVKYNFTGGYTIDRWSAVGALTVTIGTDGITLANTGTSTLRLDQNIPLDKVKAGKKYTVAVTTEEGRFCGSAELGTTAQVLCSGDEFYINFTLLPDKAVFQIRQRPGYTTKYVNIALYEGEYTLDTLPEYQPKGYGAELLECQRYYYRLEYGSYTPVFAGVSTSQTSARISVTLPVRMRINNPTVNISDLSQAQFYTESGLKSPTAIASSNGTENGVSILFTMPTITKERTMNMRFANNVTFEFSADL